MTSERLLGASSLALALGCASCDSPTPPGARSAAPRAVAKTAEMLGGTLRQSFLDRNGDQLASLMPSVGDVHVEIRDTLVETDERDFRVLKSPSDSKRWLAQLNRKLQCAGSRCPYPGGLKAPELSVCAGDCCRAQLAAGLERGTLTLKRACFAAREAGEPRLSQVVFVVARSSQP